MFFWCMMQTSFTHPGGIPKELQTAELNDNQLYLLQKLKYSSQGSNLRISQVYQAVLIDHVETKNKRGYFGKPRYCRTCKAYKVLS